MPLIFLFFIFYFLFFNLASAQKSPDAIALRVVSNPEHYSPIRWYNEKVKLKGSPQQLQVDGYQAVRDGRTVYVDAANYDLAANQLYTNIYIISYNQEAENTTGDIFGQILSHWRFNINLDMSPGNCTASTTLACINDRECPAGSGFCSSIKGEVVRNTRRLSDIADIETILAKFKQKNGKYPVLAAGSYLANKTISVWPSWQEALAKDLAATLPIDPVNELGACPGFDPVTCWNASSSSFAGSLPSDLAATTTLPVGSQAYVYRVTSDGRAYTLSTDSVDPTTIIGSSTAIIGTIGNQPPFIVVPTGSTITEAGITYVNINALTSQPLDYYIEARDPDGSLGPLSSWTINLLTPTDWTVAPYVWSQNPDLATTTNPNVRRIYINAAGAQGLYYFSVTVSDGEGGSDIKRYRVSVSNQAPIVSITPTSTIVTVGKNNLVTRPIEISAVDPEGNYPLASSTSGGPLPIGLYIKTIDQETWQITGVPTYAPTTATYNYSITFADTFGAATTKNYSITVANQRPAFASTPVMQVRVNDPYSYDVNATDADGHTVRYQFAAASGQPAGFIINNTSGLVSGTSGAAGIYNVIIEAYDGYGATTSQTYNLSVTTYCGDSVAQAPNDEGQFEDCDDGNADNLDACDSSCAWTCQALPGEPHVDLSSGQTDSIITDDNNNPNDSVMAAGNYLKLSSVMPTPYLWVSVTSHARIAKVRTFDGYRKTTTGLDYTTMETAGQVIGTYPLTLGASTASDPSRTAVNVETGDVWVAGRASGLLAKLDIDGNVKKICSTTGNFTRGVAIEESGDVWVANYSQGNAVKFSGDDSSCAPLATVALGGAPYGLAIDSDNNILVANQGGGWLQKFNTAGAPVILNYPASGNYGITVGLDDSIWAGNWYSGTGVYRLPPGSPNGTAATAYGSASNITGVTIDIQGNLWGSGNANLTVTKFDTTSGAPLFIRALSGLTPHGIVGDSAGKVWAVAYENTLRAYDLDGNVVATSVCPYDINGNGICTDDGVLTYTYSDMSGLNRAMLLRAGEKIFQFDSGFNDQHWGGLEWQEYSAPPNQRVEISVRAANATSTFSGLGWTNYVSGDPMPASVYGRYLEIRLFMRSRQRNVTPVFYNLENNCSNPKGAVSGCTSTGYSACQGCTASCGGGSCTGYQVDNCFNTRPCLITNSTACPLNCNLPQNLSCPGTVQGPRDASSFNMATLADNYTAVINNGWGYTSVFPKPTSWPAAVYHNTLIAEAASSCCYQGTIYCNNGVIYKRFASGTSPTVDLNVICN